MGLKCFVGRIEREMRGGQGEGEESSLRTDQGAEGN